MSEYKHKSHNVSVLMYHFVCPAKYRRVVIDEEVDEVIKETCEEISKRYEIDFIEIGTDKDHVHFLVQLLRKASDSSQQKSRKKPALNLMISNCTGSRPGSQYGKCIPPILGKCLWEAM